MVPRLWCEWLDYGKVTEIVWTFGWLDSDKVPRPCDHMGDWTMMTKYFSLEFWSIYKVCWMVDETVTAVSDL